MSALNHELSPDQPYLLIPNSLFMGRGITREGIHYEGFKLLDGSIHYYNSRTGKELVDD